MRRMTLSVVGITFAFLVAAGHAAAAVAPSVVAEGAYPDLAVDAAGDVHLVYVRSGTLYYRERSASAGTWSPETQPGLAAGGVNRSDPEIVVDSQDRPHVLVGSSYAYRDGSDWIHVAPGVTRDTALAIDSQDNVLVCRRGGHDGGYLGLRVRRAGASSFTALPDPDVADGLPLGRNDHVYGHVFVSPADDSIHVVYRHGAPDACAYRGSTSGGVSWFGGGVSSDDREAPSGTAAADGTLYVVCGGGTVYTRTSAPSSWSPLGRAVQAASRDLPALSTDAAGNLYVTSFGGRYNVRSAGDWVGEATLPRLSGQALGFAESAGGPGAFAYVVWEEGASVDNDAVAGTSDILFATVDADGSIGTDAEPPQPPTGLRVE